MFFSISWTKIILHLLVSGENSRKEKQKTSFDTTLRSSFLHETEENTEDLLQKVLGQGYPSALSVVQAIGMEEQFNFVNDNNQAAFLWWDLQERV